MSLLGDLYAYAKQIARKWVFWLFAIIDLAALGAQLVYPELRIPPPIFLLIALVGFFWAGYQVYGDVLSQLPSRPVGAPPYELLPLSFEITLDGEIPRIAVWLYAVNHQRKQIAIQHLEISSFNLSGGPTLESIPHSGEVPIAAMRSVQVLCRRPLNDAEARSIQRTQQRNPANATYVAHARANIGRRQVAYQTPSISSNGWTSGIPRSK